MPGFVFYASPERTPGTTSIGPYEVSAALGVPAATGRHPLVVISHGHGGSNLGHRDLATSLASHGLIVATIEHPGDNYHDSTANGKAAALIGRALQISATVSALLADDRWGPLLDSARIGVAGFSAGGYTSLLVVGAVPQFERFVDYCLEHGSDPEICTENDSIRADLAHGGRPERDFLQGIQRQLHRWGPTADPRVKAAFVMAPQSIVFDSAGLSHIDRPVFLYYAEHDQVLIPSANALRIKAFIPTLNAIRGIPNADHWVFLSPCTPSQAKVLGFICHDPPGVDRAAVHRRIAADALAFFRRTLR
jgi:predicted dienelactone hydrolase